MSEEHHGDSFYVKIWAILVGLLVISVAGPMIGIQWLTLVTAFGIAIVKAYLVVRNFMHIGQAPKFITYLVVTCLVFMGLFFSAVAPDVMEDEGSNWVKTASWQVDNSSDAATAHGGGAHH